MYDVPIPGHRPGTAKDGNTVANPPITKARFERAKRRLLAVLKEATRQLPEFESRDETIGSFLNESIVAAHCAARLGLPCPPIEHVPIPPPSFVSTWSVSAHNANVCGMKFNEPDGRSVYILVSPPSQESAEPPPESRSAGRFLDEWCRLLEAWEPTDVEYSGFRIVDADRSAEELVFNCELSLAIAGNEASVEDIFAALGPGYIEVLEKHARAIRAAALRELELKLASHHQPRQPIVHSLPNSFIAMRRAQSLVRQLHERAWAYRESYRAQKTDNTDTSVAVQTVVFDIRITDELTHFLLGHACAPTAGHFQSRWQELLAESVRLRELIESNADRGEIIVARIVLTMRLDGFVEFLERLWLDLGGTASPAQTKEPSNTTSPSSEPSAVPPAQPPGQPALERPPRDLEEITLAEASRDYGVASWAWSRAAKKAPDKPGHLPTRKVGSNILVRRDHAQHFAKQYEARREQNTVGSKSPEGRNTVAALKKMKISASSRPASKAS